MQSSSHYPTSNDRKPKRWLGRSAGVLVAYFTPPPPRVALQALTNICTSPEGRIAVAEAGRGSLSQCAQPRVFIRLSSSHHPYRSHSNCRQIGSHGGDEDPAPGPKMPRVPHGQLSREQKGRTWVLWLWVFFRFWSSLHCSVVFLLEPKSRTFIFFHLTESGRCGSDESDSQMSKKTEERRNQIPCSCWWAVVKSDMGNGVSFWVTPIFFRT